MGWMIGDSWQGQGLSFYDTCLDQL